MSEEGYQCAVFLACRIEYWACGGDYVGNRVDGEYWAGGATVGDWSGCYGTEGAEVRNEAGGRRGAEVMYVVDAEKL